MGTGKEAELTAAVLTVSTGASRGEREDVSGPALCSLCGKKGMKVVSADVVTDDREKIKSRLLYYCDGLKADIALTTGGTGLGPSDVTPEATLEIAERIVPGIPELIRAATAVFTKKSYLSRSAAVIRGKTLIINLPGSVRGASESFGAVCDILPHAIHIIKGGGHEK